MRCMPKTLRVTYLVARSKTLTICYMPMFILMENRNGRDEIHSRGLVQHGSSHSISASNVFSTDKMVCTLLHHDTICLLADLCRVL